MEKKYLKLKTDPTKIPRPSPWFVITKLFETFDPVITEALDPTDKNRFSVKEYLIKNYCDENIYISIYPTIENAITMFYICFGSLEGLRRLISKSDSCKKSFADYLASLLIEKHDLEPQIVLHFYKSDD